jgi:hypothetical protein
VPVGACTVVASSPFNAGSAPATVSAGEAMVLGAVDLPRASGFLVRVRSRGVPQEGVTVGVVEAPLQAVTDGAGRARLWALPPGPYRIGALIHDATIFGDVKANGQSDSFSDLDSEPLLDGGADLCAGVSCTGNTVCDGSDGQCYACVSAADCTLGRACAGHLCESRQASCAPCRDLSSCGGTGACLDLFDGGFSTCALPCLQDADCGASSGYGYVCAQGLCRPDLAVVNRCEASGALGQRCSTTDSCRQAGLVRGVCDLSTGVGTCSVSCQSSVDCPGALHCAQIHGGAGICGP